MANPTIGVDWAVKLQSLEQQLAQAPDIGGKAAKELTAQLSKEIRAAERAYKKSTANMALSLESMVDKGGRSAVKLRGLLSSIHPQLGQIANAADDVADAFEAGAIGGPVMLGVAAAVGAAYLAYRTYNEEGARAERIAGIVEESHRALEPILRDTEQANIDLAVAVGSLTEEEGKLATQALRTAAAIEAANAPTEARLKEIRAAQTSWTTALADFVEVGEDAGGVSWLVAKGFDGILTSSSELQGEMATLTEEQRANIKAAKENRQVQALLLDVQSNNTASRRAAADAEREEAERVREITAAIRAETEARDAAIAAADARRAESIKARQDAAKDTAALVGEAAQLGMSPQDKAAAEAAAFTAQIDHQIEENERLGVVVAGLQEARTQAEQHYQEVVQAGIDEEKAARLDAAMQAIDAVAGFGDAVKDAGKAGFAVWKATAVAQAVGNAIGAFNTALASIPPPFGAIVGAASLATGLVNAGKIAATQPAYNDTPGPVQMGSRGGSARFAPGDLVVAAQNEDGLREQVGAMSSGPSLLQLEHRYFGRYIRDEVQRPTSLSTSIGESRTTRAGRRKRTY